MPTSKHISFPGHNRTHLSGRLELPDAAPRCYAIFSHCFTCSKDILTVYRISKRLAELGIATLRFDFTGLGESKGNFADTNFSTNIQDILTATDFLAHEFEAPKLLIGHSLGGTAALACAEQLDSVKAVVTIASPSQPSHVLHHFGETLDALLADKNANITIAGKSYAFKPQFIRDLKQYDMHKILAQLHKTALIFSVENDALVKETNAEDIQKWLSGESVVITLKNTDHLLSDITITTEVAERISEWLKIYIEARQGPTA